ncbi:hypothetical protein ND440_09790 [Yersinia ruckeri]|uniref:hypothetical protein n=1 Tax=Yersinia ruckeri TaxID=29486 RepID=UPI001FEA8828|nr:hypothetical protein [Yersinia ruckeri]MCW6540976.1 hypothetical protein [Yersinia ruckeri]MCW6556852.1 hypothetical protein [Yersinia ruckeri]MCW6638620.1 hypothetical protein [Yersinia ruckeri]UZX63987.1 hypothetical protein ND440_09790 [Yersinia ruckeri]UZX73935.1 hypothetical protein ND012_09500 [Yersinia ruckeri]
MKVTNINYTDTLCTLSADEQRVAQMLGDAWNQYLQLSMNTPVNVMSSAEPFTIARGSY